MATDRLAATPGVFLAAARPAPAPATATTAPRTSRAPHHRRAATLLTTAALVLVAGGVLVGHAVAAGPSGAAAGVAALASPQRATDVLSDDDVARLVVQPGSTRLLLRTRAGAHYVARSASGDLCLVRVPDGDLPSEVCVPDRVGADATIGDDDTGRVRLVADGAPRPATGDGWRPAGPNVWVRG